ncbi:MAG: VOC family protein [Dehalococcoidia bacterium]|nr:VOC family protein [Dehalococcoidia bacterium]NQT05349.1 VOC family protein [Dehalococcoidia bacterium]
MVKSVQHFGLTVSNLDEARHFFHDLLGLEATEVRETSGERPEIILGIPGVSLRLCLFKLPDGNNLEVIEYLNPRGTKLDLRTCNPGVPHIAFIVDDIQKMYDELSAKGVKFVNPPYWGGESVAGPGWGVCFLRGPDGISIEFMQAPKGK